MAYLLPCYSYISKSLCTESTFTCKATRLDHGSWKLDEQKRHVSKFQLDIGGKNADKEENFEYLVKEFGWKVRRLVEDQHEMREVAHIQAEAFHAPVALFDDFFFQFFKAEVLSALIYKLRNSPSDRYACLVAEPTADSSKPQGKLVGIVDVTASRDEDVLQHLSGAGKYLYVSGIAVPKHLRRQKIATVLLKACDVLSITWGFDYLALRAYEDDLGARKLYANAGYRLVSSDPQWLAWMGRRRRVLMVKRSNLLDQMS